MKTDIVDLASLPAVPCPCGASRRAFVEESGGACSVHMVDVKSTAAAHHHERLTETYYVLAGDGEIELDGTRQRVRPGCAVLIRPGTVHRLVPAEGIEMKILNFVTPAFDAADEFVEGA